MSTLEGEKKKKIRKRDKGIVWSDIRLSKGFLSWYDISTELLHLSDYN